MTTASCVVLRTSLGLGLALLGVMSDSVAPALGMATAHADPNVATQSNARSWTPTGSLNKPHVGHVATALPNGKVLVVGGSDGEGAPAPPELYDPATASWSVTGRLNSARTITTEAMLPDGRVLVVGGSTPNSYTVPIGTAELYDQASGTWSLTGSLNTARYDHTATALLNGKVLVVGGIGLDSNNNLGSTELYDPTTGLWRTTGSLNAARSGHSATLLRDGKVLVAGGVGGQSEPDGPYVLSSAELYDPVAGTWSRTGALLTPVTNYTATLLQSGKVLVAGGYGTDFSAGGNGVAISLDKAQLYDPVTGAWSYAANLNSARGGHAATLLPDGQVLVEGGYDVSSQLTLNSAELYDPNNGTWTNTSNLNASRNAHTATLLADGTVLVAGGESTSAASNSILNTAEFYKDVASAPGTIGPGFTGAWYNPAQSGHGLMIEVLSNSRFYATWFAFDLTGTQQAWFTGVGTYSGNTATITQVTLPTGGRWIPHFDPNQVARVPWGTLTFTFSDCDHGVVDFNSIDGYGSGSMSLTRLTQPAGVTCP